MRSTRLFFEGELHDARTLTLGADASNHLIRVLRSTTGTQVILFNGDGYDYHCTTLDEHPKHTAVQIDTRSRNNSESSIHITLLQGVSRQDRMENSIQKAVELGVNRIIPLACQRSNIKSNRQKMDKKTQHWKKVIISACEQSGRSMIPEITPLISWQQLDEYIDGNTYGIALDPLAERSLKSLDATDRPASDKVAMVIGPEGGLNEAELEALEMKGFKRFRFGPRILRTETAGPALISALQLLWGDF